MIMKRLKYILLATWLGSMSLVAQSTNWGTGVIPEPQSIDYGKGTFTLPAVLTHSLSPRTPEYKALEALLRDVFEGKTKLSYRAKGAKLDIKLDASVQDAEGYRLIVSGDGIRLRAKTSQGLRYGLETLRQLLDKGKSLAFVTIDDAPRYKYRGLMLDVSRHVFPASYIKSLLSEMSRLKLNRFHWHLVDGAGWRMESKAYPLLTEKSAYRKKGGWDEWWHSGDRSFTTKDDPNGYGGYYTQSEIRDVVAHATKLGITIIPEIEMPGHSTELIHSYPDLLCPTATPKDATDVCIGNEATFTFFERILDETMALFPSKYIHIGGDEAAMNHWGKCPRCQERMKKEGLKDLHELQSYMIKRIEKYLNSKGRKIIGWDEILMGGLAPDATVMSWRGESGGIAAANAGHDVIMSPNGNLYLDYYQSEAADLPRAIGGYVTMEKVYDYNPTPEALKADKRHHVMGVQANLWTEYIETPEHVSYMYFPRALALAEVGWTERSRKDFNVFRTKATHYIKGLEQRGHKAYPMTGIAATQTYDRVNEEMRLSLIPERTDAVVRYTLDGTSPTATSDILTPGQTIISRNNRHTEVCANVFVGNERLNKTDRVYRLDKHLGLESKVHYNSKWNERYPANSTETLKDGLWGTPTYLDGRWQGFTEPMDVTFELPKARSLKSVDMRFMAEREQWVYMPKTVEVLVSEDGVNYKSLGVQTPKTLDTEVRPVFENFVFKTTERAKFVRVKASIGRSEGHFIFCDEVVIH